MTTTTIGTTGAPWRAAVTRWGDVACGARTLAWHVAADDRWHHPAEEAGVRQRRLDGAPVLETRLRVPQGDVAQRVFAVTGGLVVVELDNESALPVAVALSDPAVLGVRAGAPALGEGAPTGSVVVPLAHRSSLRLAWPVTPEAPPALPERLPTAAQVARGWRTFADTSVRVVLPDDGLTDAVVGARAALALDGPAGDDDPAGFLLGVDELGRLGLDPAPWVDDVARAGEALARQGRRRGLGWDGREALWGAARVLARAGEERAAGDARRLASAAGGGDAPRPGLGDPAVAGLDPGRLAAAVRCGLVAPGDGATELFAGLPVGWYGQPVEVYGAPGRVGPVSAAIRWHGERPAVLWEAGEGELLRCRRLDPAWAPAQASGEALLAAP